VAFADEDILTYDVSTGAWSMYFDGSDLGLSSNDLDALAPLDDGSILLSFSSSSSLPGAGYVDDSDIVRFVPTSTGNNTSGTFELIFDASDVGLSGSGEDIDAIAFAPDGRLLISTISSFSVSGVSGQDEDLIAFSASSWGTTTRGTWSMYFDGSDVGLGDSGYEDLYGVWSDSETGEIFLTTRGSFSVSGSSGDGADIFVCRASSLGGATVCTFGPGLYYDGSANGFANEVMDGMAIVR
jgi:hypothetical protein